MTSMTRHYSDAAGQVRNAADKTADLWAQGTRGLTDLVPRRPQIDLIPAVERYFDLVQRMVDVNRHLTVKWVEAADTLTGVVRHQAESAADVAREMPASVGHVVHVQAAKAEQERVRPERPSTSRPGRPMTRPASATRA